MRITVKLDDDVAAALQRFRRQWNCRLKEVVNAALRRELAEMQQSAGPRKPYRVKPFNVRRCLLPNLDCTGELMVMADEEDIIEKLKCPKSS